MQDIAIYGFGGLGREVSCLLQMINSLSPQWNLIGYFDDRLEVGAANKYGTVLGGLDALNHYPRPLAVVMAIASSSVLYRIVSQIENNHITFPNLIAPGVVFYDKSTLKIGKGNVCYLGTRISCDVTLGDFNLINADVSLGHDVTLGNYNVISPNTRLSGESFVGDRNFFGVRSTLLQGIFVGNDTRIGMGSIVARNTEDGCLYFGNPARKTEIK